MAIAKVYVVNDGLALVPIPSGLSIRDDTNNVSVAALDQNKFVLAWTDAYTITYNNEIVLSVNNQRQWSLRGPSDREIKTLED